MSPAPARPEPLEIPGPAGQLEALLSDPNQPGPPGFAVVCHPHPLHGGTMHNKVVYTVARAFEDLGMPTLRFNYRGVGASAGRYDNGRGELLDALAVIAYGRARWPHAPLALGGFSFGALVALRASLSEPVAHLVTVAPPVSRPESAIPERPACPWLIVQGDADEIVDHRQVTAYAERFSPPPQLQVLAGVDHFFHGRLRELHEAVRGFAVGEGQ